MFFLPFFLLKSLSQTYRTNRFVFYIQTESEFTPHFTTFLLTFFLYCTPLKICLRSFLAITFRTLTFDEVGLERRGKSTISPHQPPSPFLRCVCVKLNLPLIIIITFNMYISSIFLSFHPLLGFPSDATLHHKTAPIQNFFLTFPHFRLNSYPSYDPLTDLQFRSRVPLTRFNLPFFLIINICIVFFCLFLFFSFFAAITFLLFTLRIRG